MTVWVLFTFFAIICPSINILFFSEKRKDSVFLFLMVINLLIFLGGFLLFWWTDQLFCYHNNYSFMNQVNCMPAEGVGGKLTQAEVNFLAGHKTLASMGKGTIFLWSLGAGLRIPVGRRIGAIAPIITTYGYVTFLEVKLHAKQAALKFDNDEKTRHAVVELTRAIEQANHIKMNPTDKAWSDYSFYDSPIGAQSLLKEGSAKEPIISAFNPNLSCPSFTNLRRAGDFRPNDGEAVSIWAQTTKDVLSHTV
jgi:hypothetical protein